MTISTFIACNVNIWPQDVNSQSVISAGKFIVLFTWLTYITYSIDGRTVRCYDATYQVICGHILLSEHGQSSSFDAHWTWTWAIFLISFILFHLFYEKRKMNKVQTQA